MIKCFCSMCGYTVRVSARWLDVAPPICPTDHAYMIDTRLLQWPHLHEEIDGEAQAGLRPEVAP
jgi:hypothetical protein